MVRRFIVAALAISLSTATANAQFLGKKANEWAADLERGDESLRRNAAFALGKLGPAAKSEAAALKRAAVGDKSAKVREACAFALGEIALRSADFGKDGELQTVLSKSLGDGDPLVRRSAAYALGCLGADASVTRPAVEAALRDTRPEVRQSAAWALGRLGDDGIAALRVALADADELVLRDAAGSLGLLDPRAGRVAVFDLAKLAGHTDVEVRKASLFALVAVVKPADAKANAISTPLQKALLDGDEEIRRNAAFALSNIGGTTAAPAVDVLLDALRTGDLEIQRQAAAAFGNIGPAADRAVPELTERLRGPDQELRINASRALGGIGRRAEAAVPTLADLVANRETSTDVRAQAAVALSMIGDVKQAVAIVPKLLAVVADPTDNGKVRERVMWALRVHNVDLQHLPGVSAAFRKILMEGPTAENRMVRQDCAYVVGMVFGPKAPAEVFPVLLDYLKDETVQVYRNTATLVGGAAQETSAGKISSRELGEGDGRKLVLDALTKIGAVNVRNHPEILDQIRRLADSDRTVAVFRQQCRDYLRTVAP